MNDGRILNKFPSYIDTVCYHIADLNRKLPNIEKWAITSDAMYSVNFEPYDATRTYTIQLSTYCLGQLSELRKIIKLFYRHHINDMFYALASVGMIDLFHEIFEEGYTYRYRDPNMPKLPECDCHMIDYREDEYEPTCRECHEYVHYNNRNSKKQKTDEETNEHFHLIPYPQRRHMVITKELWVLAFLLEGYIYTFVEPNPNHIPKFNYNTHEYFRFYTTHVYPNKTEIRNYIQSRILMGEYFDEPDIYQQPTITPTKDDSVANNILKSPTTIPYIVDGLSSHPPKRYIHTNWWETPNY